MNKSICLTLFLFVVMVMSGQELKPNRLSVRYFNLDNTPTSIELDKIFESSNLLTYNIDCINWEDRNNNYSPTVYFKIFYTSAHLCVKFYVKEKTIHAIYKSDAECQPWKEDCLELFIVPDPDSKIYFNIETSCIGYGIVGKGAERKERERLDPSQLSRLIRVSSLGNKPIGTKSYDSDDDNYFEWNLIVAIPWDILLKNKSVKDIKGKVIKGNLYKCGDAMPQPHYLSWSPIFTPNPNFHTPEYFGEFYMED